MHRFFLMILLLLPTGAPAAENLIDVLYGHDNAVITDGVIYQVKADTRPDIQWKLQAWYNNTKHNLSSGNVSLSYEYMWIFSDTRTGFMSYTFKMPNDLDDFAYLRFGINGATVDSSVIFNIKDLMPNTTYTLQWRVLNTTQGEVAWTDMFLTHCGDGYSLELGKENCSLTCANKSVAGGHIPPDAARVYEPEICTYDPARLTCDDGYVLIDNACDQMCTAGITHLYVGNIAHGLYARKNETPALHVGYNGNVCYGHLSPGVGSGLNLNIDGTIYHLID